jgi:SAM-dependent methyltransferase
MIRVQISTIPSTTDILTAFPEWIIQCCDSTSVALDVGAGQDRNKIDALIRPKIAHLVGIDPTEDIMHNPALDERYQATLENFAQEYHVYFDCLYSMFVLEHVTHPHDFFKACRSLLKSNGILFGVTPNLWHYFGLATKISSTIGMEDWLLERLVGKQKKEAYHFPTTYRVNSIRAIVQGLEQTGFQSVEFRCFDPTKRLEFYFPRLLKWYPGVYSHLVHHLHLSRFMGYLVFKATAN